MPTVDSYNAQTTSVSFSWPPHTTGVERVMLSAQGDLQRLLSAFFSKPITVALLHSQTSSYHAPDHSLTPLSLPNPDIVNTASPQNPIIQTRKVNLLCASQIVCTATSTVRITCPKSARLFLEEKFAIGQVFRELGTVPRFDLIAVGVNGNIDGNKCGSTEKQELWRKYKVDCEGFECEIFEVFPTREMFVHGNNWLQLCSTPEDGSFHSFIISALTQKIISLFPVLMLGFLVNHILHIALSSGC